MIRLVAKHGDGLTELEILRIFSSRKEAFRGANRCMRMQREIAFAGMVFAVFPLLSRGMDNPPCETLSEVVELLDQLLVVCLSPIHRN